MAMKVPERLTECGFQQIDAAAETGMISRWLLYANTSVFSTQSGSPVSVRRKRYAASSVTRWRASSLSCGAQKNNLQGMRSNALGLVRPHEAASARFVLRQHARHSRHRGSAGSLPMLRQGEAGEARLAFPTTRSTPSGSPGMSDAAAARAASRLSPKNCIWTGTPSRNWTSRSWPPSGRERVRLAPRPSASTKSRS